MNVNPKVMTQRVGYHTHLTGLSTSPRSPWRTSQRSRKRLLHKCPPNLPPWKSAAHVCRAFNPPCCNPATTLLRYYRGTADLLALVFMDGPSWKSCTTSAPCVGCSCRLTLPLGTKALEKCYARKESARRDEETGMALDRDSLQEQQGENESAPLVHRNWTG